MILTPKFSISMVEGGDGSQHSLLVRRDDGTMSSAACTTT